MADLNFPNPGVQQQYTFVGKTWNWDGQRWAFASSGSGITKLNNLTNSVQNFLIGYSGAFPNIVSSGTDHTFNFPIASTGATGLVNTSSQTFAGDKTFASTTNATYIGVGGVVVHGGIAISGNAAIGGSAIFTNTSNTNTIAFRSGNQANTLTYILPTANPTSGQVLSASAPASGVVTLSWANDQTGSGGLASLNGETASTQLFATSTTGTDFTITSSAGTHTFNIPIAGSGSTGLITTLAQTIAGAKTFSSSITGNLSGTATTAENVVVTATARNVIHYLTFTNQATGTGLGLTTSNAGVGFTVNPALGTLAATIFVGNLSGTAATVTNFYGSLVGTATTARNVSVSTAIPSSDFYVTFTNASTGSGLALSTSTVGSGLTFNPATSSLSAVLFTGTAVTSQNVSVSPAIPSSNFYVTFTNASTGSGLALSTSTVGAGLTFNPATSSLSAVLFTGTATTARNVSVTTTALSGIHYLTFTNAQSGTGLGLTTSNAGVGFTVNPALGTLAATTFLGNLSGTAATITNIYGNLVGTATTAQNANVVSADSTGNHYLLFSPTNGGSGVALSVDGGLTFVPTTNILTTTVFSGNLSATGATITTILNAQGDVSLGDATGDTVTFNARVGSSINPSSNNNYDLGTTSLRWRNGFVNYLTGTAFTSTDFYGNLSGTATTAQNVVVTSTGLNVVHQIIFANAQSGTGLGLTTSNVGVGFTVNPALGTMSATTFLGNHSGTAATFTNFYGTLNGNVTGTATTSQNVSVSTAIPSSDFYVTFTNASTGSGLALSTSTVGSGLTFNPATSSLSAVLFTGTATTARNVTVATTALNGTHYLTFTNAQSGTGLGLTTSNVGVGFTVNPALGIMAATTFVGNLSGTAATATNFYGSLVGTATTSQNVSVSTAIPSSNFYVTFTSASTGSGLALSTSSVGAGLTFNPATSSLSAVLFTGTATTSRNSVVTTTNVSTDHHILFANASSGSGLALSTSSVGAGLTFNPATSSLSAVLFTGTASTSRNVSLTTTALNGIHYLTFANAQTGSGLALTTSNAGVGFTVNPALNTLSAGTFIGNISGTAATVTNFYGSLNGNVTGTATTSQNVHVATTTISTNHHILFTNAQNGTGLGLSTSNVGIGLTFNPATSTLSAVLFTGTANTSRNSVINSTTISSDHYLVFANASSGSGLALSTSTVGSGLTFNPATSSLSAVIFTGTANTSRNSVVNSTTISADHYLIFANASSGSGLALSTSTVGIGLTFNPATSTLSAVSFTGTATTARNSVITSTTLSTNHYLLFTNASSGSGLALSTGAVGSGLTYNPNTNTLSALFFTGTATTARNVDLTNTTVNGIHYLTFANGTSGSGFGLTTSSVGVGFTVNPALNTMAAGTFLGNVSGSATTSTYITGILRNASYVQGDLLAGASTGNTLTRVPVGANNRYFLKPDSNTQSGLGWSTFAGVFVTSLAPASPTFTLVEGDLWYKVDDGSFNVYYTDVDETAQWVEIVSSGGGTGGGAPAGSNTYVQFNTSGAFDAVPDFTFDINKNQLTISNFPWATPDNGSAALKLLGEGTWFGSADGTFLAINATTAFTGDLIHAKVNNVQKFKVASDGATTIATLNSSGTVYSNGGTLTNSNPSDQNLKENIQSMIGGTSIVNQLNPVSFEWKSGIGGAGTKYGFIAQEVQEIIPDIVSIDSSGTIGLDTVSLIPFLVKSIKEQQETIEQLRAEIQFIKTELGI